MSIKSSKREQDPGEAWSFVKWANEWDIVRFRLLGVRKMWEVDEVTVAGQTVYEAVKKVIDKDGQVKEYRSGGLFVSREKAEEICTRQNEKMKSKKKGEIT